jgi:hypothetical protein
MSGHCGKSCPTEIETKTRRHHTRREGWAAVRSAASGPLVPATMGAVEARFWQFRDSPNALP